MKQILTFSLALLLMFSTGCSQISLFSNYRPIDRLLLVHTIGFDAHKDGLTLSVCAGEQEEQGIVRLQCSGANISDCMETLQNFSGKTELYFAHTRFVLVGEEYARQGLGDVMQYLEQSTQLRSDLPLFVVKGETASKAVMQSGDEKQGIHDILEAVLRDCEARGMGFPFTCGDIGSYSAEYGSALACALTVTPTKDIDPKAEDDRITPIAAGYGIIDYGALVGFLSTEASRGVNLLINESGTGSMTLHLNGQPVSLRIDRCKIRLQPTVTNRKTISNLKVDAEIKINVAETREGHHIDQSHLEQELSNTIRQWIEELLLAMRSSECDFLGLGPRIAMEYPSVEWTPRQLQALPMEAQVQCRIAKEDTP